MFLTVRDGPHRSCPKAHRVPVHPKGLLHSYLPLSRHKASLSQAPRLGDLPSPHGTFQEHAAHIAKWPAMLSSKGSRGTCIPRGLATFLPCAFTAHIDHPVSRVPDAPQLHLSLTVGTPEGITPRALLIPLPIGQPSDNLPRAFNDALDLR